MWNLKFIQMVWRNDNIFNLQENGVFINKKGDNETRPML